MAVFDLQVTGAPEAIRAIKSWKKRVDNVRAVSSQLHKRLLQWQKQVFETQGGAIGEAWPTYKGSEIAYAKAKAEILGFGKENWKKMARGSSGLLRWKGENERLYPSLTRDNRDHIWRDNDWPLEFGTSVSYASDHQEGGVTRTIDFKRTDSKLRVRVQKRTFLKLDEGIVSSITKSIRRFMGLGA